MLGATDIAFDDDAAAFIERGRVGGLDFFPAHQVGEYAASMIAVMGFDDNRNADFFGSFPGIRRAVDQTTFGDWHTAGLQDALGQILVA